MSKCEMCKYYGTPDCKDCVSGSKFVEVDKECYNCKHWEREDNEYPCSECKGTAIGGSAEYSDREHLWERAVPKARRTATSIKDSGQRTEFATGAVRDIQEGKGRMDLLPWAAIMAVSKHCENGAKKYGEHNADKGIPTHSLCDSAARHLAKYLDGWDDEPHLLAATWNLLWAVQMEIHHPELCDVPWVNE